MKNIVNIRTFVSALFLLSISGLSAQQLTVNLYYPFPDDHARFVIRTETINIPSSLSCEALKVRFKQLFDIPVSLQTLFIRKQHNASCLESKLAGELSQMQDEETLRGAAQRLNLSKIFQIDLFMPELHELFYLVLPGGKQIVIKYSDLGEQDDAKIEGRLRGLVEQAITYDLGDEDLKGLHRSSYSFYYFRDSRNKQLYPLAYMLLTRASLPSLANYRTYLDGMQSELKRFIFPFVLFFPVDQQCSMYEPNKRQKNFLMTAMDYCKKINRDRLPEQFKGWYNKMIKPSGQVASASAKQEADKKATSVIMHVTFQPVLSPSQAKAYAEKPTLPSSPSVPTVMPPSLTSFTPIGFNNSLPEKPLVEMVDSDTEDDKTPAAASPSGDFIPVTAVPKDSEVEAIKPVDAGASPLLPSVFPLSAPNILSPNIRPVPLLEPNEERQLVAFGLQTTGMVAGNQNY